MIKKLCQKAGITDPITIMETRGGKRQERTYAKYELVTSHAGISAVWMKAKGFDTVDEINSAFVRYPKHLNFVEKENASMTGDNDYQCPLWIRPKSLLRAAWGNVHQVMGHTHAEETQTALMHNGKQLLIADALPNEYLIIDTQTHHAEAKQP
jgi:hypothetical protein